MKEIGMTNSLEFISLFNEIDKHLRQLTGIDAEASFSHVLKEAAKRNRAVRGYKEDLQSFAGLRNAIVHDSIDQIIADPNDWAIDRIKKIRSILLDPPKVSKIYSGRDVMTFNEDETIVRAISRMYEEQYSQAPIYRNSNEWVGLLTSNTISRWLASCVQDDILILEGTKIAEVLQYAEYEDDYSFLKKSTTLFDILYEFRRQEDNGKKLEAVLVTENGRANERPLGIITVYDLPRIHNILGIPSDAGPER